MEEGRLEEREILSAFSLTRKGCQSGTGGRGRGGEEEEDFGCS